MLVAEDLNIFRRLTAENENSTTELLANLMSRKLHGAHEIGQRGGFGRTAVREVPDS